MALIFIILIRNTNFRGGYDEYIGYRQTRAINGLFIMFVFLSHFSQYIVLDSMMDIIYLFIKSLLGQTVVTTFLFYSGYGVMHSIMWKGESYIKTMPKNRILKTLLLFDIAITLYIILNIFLGIDMSYEQVVLSFIGWTSVGNSNWYIFAILVMYLISYIAFKVAGEKKIMGLILSTILIAMYVLIVSRCKESWYYNTVFCYGVGLWFAFFKDKIDIFLSNSKIYFVTLSIMMAILFLSYMFPYNDYFQVKYIFFVTSVVIVSMKVQINSPILVWCGENLLGIFILHRLPMIALGQYDWMISHQNIYFVLCLVISIFLVIVYQHLVIRNINTMFGR